MAAFDNNKRTGTAPVFPPFYDDFAEVLKDRYVVNMPYTVEVGSSKMGKEEVEEDSTSTEEIASP